MGPEASIAEPGTMLLAFGAATVWAHLRRVLRRGELEPWTTAGAWLLPVPAAAAGVGLVGVGPGLRGRAARSGATGGAFGPPRARRWSEPWWRRAWTPRARARSRSRRVPQV